MDEKLYPEAHLRVWRGEGKTCYVEWNLGRTIFRLAPRKVSLWSPDLLEGYSFVQVSTCCLEPARIVQDKMKCECGKEFAHGPRELPPGGRVEWICQSTKARILGLAQRAEKTGSSFFGPPIDVDHVESALEVYEPIQVLESWIEGYSSDPFLRTLAASQVCDKLDELFQDWKKLTRLRKEERLAAAFEELAATHSSSSFHRGSPLESPAAQS